jgi:hypothetical protein
MQEAVVAELAVKEVTCPPTQCLREGGDITGNKPEYLLMGVILSGLMVILYDRLCGLVVRVPGYTPRGPGFDFQRCQIF